MIAGNPYLTIQGGNSLMLGNRNLTKDLESYAGAGPMYVYASSALQAQCSQMASFCFRVKGNAGLNSCTAHYAVKANNNKTLLSMIVAHEIGVECASAQELQHVRGIWTSEEIISEGISHTDTQLARIVQGEQKVKVLVLDGESSVRALIAQLDLNGGMGPKIKVALRLNPDHHVRTSHEKINTSTESSKFGSDEKTVRKLFSLLMQFKQVEIAGIHLHVGSQIMEPARWASAITKHQGLICNMFELYGATFLDIGGGFAVPYGSQQKVPDLFEYSDRIVEALRAFPRDVRQSMDLVVEPGRYLTAQAGVLLSDVLAVKGDFLVLEASMAQLLRPALYNARHDVIELRPGLRKGALREFQVVGSACETGDDFGTFLLPSDIQRGDQVILANAGAYGFTMSSRYNSFPEPYELVL